MEMHLSHQGKMALLPDTLRLTFEGNACLQHAQTWPPPAVGVPPPNNGQDRMTMTMTLAFRTGLMMKVGHNHPVGKVWGVVVCRCCDEMRRNATKFIGVPKKSCKHFCSDVNSRSKFVHIFLLMYVENGMYCFDPQNPENNPFLSVHWCKSYLSYARYQYTVLQAIRKTLKNNREGFMTKSGFFKKLPWLQESCKTRGSKQFLTTYGSTGSADPTALYTGKQEINKSPTTTTARRENRCSMCPP